MVNRYKCAFLRKGGDCLLHREPCSCNPLTLRCPDGVRRANPHPDISKWANANEYDFGTAIGRMKFATRTEKYGAVHSQCGKKKRYPTEYRAKEVARLRVRSGAAALRVYSCHFCGGWHLTSHIEHDEWAVA